jgi:hypothetical protein
MERRRRWRLQAAAAAALGLMVVGVIDYRGCRLLQHYLPARAEFGVAREHQTLGLQLRPRDTELAPGLRLRRGRARRCESFMRVHWVAVPQELRARRANRPRGPPAHRAPRRRGGAAAAAAALPGGCLLGGSQPFAQSRLWLPSLPTHTASQYGCGWR